MENHYTPLQQSKQVIFLSHNLYLICNKRSRNRWPMKRSAKTGAAFRREVGKHFFRCHHAAENTACGQRL